VSINSEEVQLFAGPVPSRGSGASAVA